MLMSYTYAAINMFPSIIHAIRPGDRLSLIPPGPHARIYAACIRSTLHLQPQWLPDYYLPVESRNQLDRGTR